jgi:hypothetical protein
VDKLIVSTIVTISVSGLLGRAIYSIHLAQGPEVAAQWNLWIEASLAVRKHMTSPNKKNSLSLSLLSVSLFSLSMFYRGN